MLSIYVKAKLMNTKTQEHENTVPVTWEDAVKAKALEMQRRAESISTGSKYISFKGGLITLDEVPVPGNKMELIVLSFLAENAWYEKSYNAAVKQKPACFALYKDDSMGEMVPHPDVPHPISENCHDCPKFQWRSDPSGSGKGKACKTRVRLAVMSGYVNTVEEVKAAEIRLCLLPVTSVKGFNKFLSSCFNLHQAPPFSLVSELSLVPDAATQFKVVVIPKVKVATPLMSAVYDKVLEAEKLVSYSYLTQEEEEEYTDVPNKVASKL